MPLQCRNAFMTLAGNESLFAFYSQLLEQSPHPYIPHRYAEFQLPGLRLAIFKPSAENAVEFSSPHQSSMSLCLEVEDLEAAIAHLTQLGAPPPGEIITASHGREIYAYDPAGNRLILHQS